jgi:hypothetical protein
MCSAIYVAVMCSVYKYTQKCSVADPNPNLDPNPDLSNPGLLDPDPDPPVRGMDPAPALDPDPSIIKHK